MREYQPLCLQILGDVDRLVANLKLLPSAVRYELVSAIQRKLLQETELVDPGTSNVSDNEESDPSDRFEENQEINIVVNENGDILKLDRATCETEQHQIAFRPPYLHGDLAENDGINNNLDSQIGTGWKRRISRGSSRVKICPVCNKNIKYHNNNDFENHLKLHTGEKKYKCGECEKSFISQSRLTHHKQNVHDPPKYQCSYCEKLFRAKVSLERHILVHSDERPHQCEFCLYKARTVGNLNSHVRAVHVKENTVSGKAKHLLKDSSSFQLFNPVISTSSSSEDLNAQELFISENVTLTFEEFD